MTARVHVRGRIERVNQLAHALSTGASQRGVAWPSSRRTHTLHRSAVRDDQLGALFVPLNYRLDPAKIEYMLTTVKPRRSRRLRLRGEGPAGTGRHPCGDVHRLRARPYDGEWEAYSGILDGQPTAEPDRPEMAEDDDASINYTSGTTGEPEAGPAHRRPLDAVFNQHMVIRDDDTYLWTLPMFHCNGWGHTYAITGTGGTHVCQRTFDAADTFRRVRETTCRSCVARRRC